MGREGRGRSTESNQERIGSRKGWVSSPALSHVETPLRTTRLGKRKRRPPPEEFSRGRGGSTEGRLAGAKDNLRSSYHFGLRWQARGEGAAIERKEARREVEKKWKGTLRSLSDVRRTRSAVESLGGAHRSRKRGKTNIKRERSTESSRDEKYPKPPVQGAGLPSGPVQRGRSVSRKARNRGGKKRNKKAVLRSLSSGQGSPSMPSLTRASRRKPGGLKEA